MKYWSLLIAAVLLVGSLDAEAARRLGGGSSIGRQSPNVTQREAAKPPAAPAQAQKSQAQQPAAAPQTQLARRGFGGMLAGLAAGLGLAWLAHALGFGEAFATVLLLLLLGIVAIAVIGAIMRARRGPAARGYAFQGAGAGSAPEAAVPPRQYNPDKVGNDASARPWERSSMAFDASKAAGAGGVRIGAALEGSQTWGVPAGFDAEGFVAAAKRNFVTLQDAWDRGDISSLRSMMTDEMLAEIRKQLAERGAQGQAGRTEVEMLQAQLLGIEDLGDEYMASVEFSGMIREDPSAGPSPFREVWNMTKPKAGGSGWLVAGVQALQ